MVNADMNATSNEMMTDLKATTDPIMDISPYLELPPWPSPPWGGQQWLAKRFRFTNLF
jgi:hypothetical protein